MFNIRIIEFLLLGEPSSENSVTAETDSDLQTTTTIDLPANQ